MIHRSVMLNEVIEYLEVGTGSKIIDATLNGGGHSVGILEKYPDAKILGIEFDPDIFQEFQRSSIASKISAINDTYTNIKNISEEYSFQPDGIIFDLGISSWHYERSKRGFTFMKDEPLDMRFNPRVNEQTAADIVNKLSREEIENVIADYGEEKFAPQIAKSIVEERRNRPIVNTSKLVEIINSSVPPWYRRQKIHPATKTFQALRIAVNGELDNVASGVISAIDILKSGGRLIVISFHGLEDKIVREIFKQKTKNGIVRWVVKGTIKPKWEEIRQNPRARSAKMKIIEKL